MTDQKRGMTVGDLPGSYAIDILLTAEGRNGLWYLIRARNSKLPRHVELFVAYGLRDQSGIVQAQIECSYPGIAQAQIECSYPGIAQAQIECSYPGNSSGYDAAVAAIDRAIARGQ